MRAIALLVAPFFVACSYDVDAFHVAPASDATIDSPGDEGVDADASDDVSLDDVDTGPCGSTFTECGGTCVDVTVDEKNCGKCGQTCASGQKCRKGTCK